MNLLDKILGTLIKNRIRGAGQLTKVLKGNNSVTLSNSFGLKMRLDPFDYVQREIIINGFYESEVYLTISSLLKPQDVFWDVGSNVGLHALTISKNFPDVHCVAFEPNYLNFCKLILNEKINKLKIKKCNFALGDKLEVAKIYVTPFNLGRSSLIDIDRSEDQRINIVSITGDYLVNNLIFPQPNIIKIDVEGFELNVLKGISSILNNKNLRAIIFESPNRLKKGDLVWDLLDEMGFEIKKLNRNEETDNAFSNFVAKRK